MKLEASRSLIWALAESGGLSIVSLATIFVVARIIGPFELGTVSLALSIIQMLAIIAETLLHDALVQRGELEESHLSSAFWVSLVFSLGFAGLCWLAAPQIALIFATPDIAPLLSWGSLGLVFTGMGSVPLAILRRKLMFKAIAVRTLYARLAGAVAAIAMALLGYGVWCLVGQYLVQTALNGILVWPACPWRPKFHFSFRHSRELLSFGAFSVASRVVWLCNLRLFTMLVGYFLGVTAVGYLNMAQRLVDTLYDVLAGPAYNLALSILSRYQYARGSFVQAFLSASEFTVLSISPIFIGLAVCATSIVTVLLGHEWLPAVPLIQTLAVGTLLQFIILLAGAAITASGRPGLDFTLSVASFSFVMAVFLLVRPDDALEATQVWVSRLLVTGPVVLFIVYRYLDIAPGDLIRSIWKPLVITAIMAAALSAIEREFLQDRPALYVLLVLVPLGVTIYGAGLMVACRDTLRRLLEIVATGLQKPGPS